MNIELRKYSRWPDMKKLSQEEMMDNICLSFEIAITDGSKKEHVIYASGHVLIDNYENQMNVSFDIPQCENDTNSFYLFREEKNTIKKNISKKIIEIENNTTSISLKRDFNLVCSKENKNIKNLNSLISHFLIEDILPDIQKIKPFLKEHKINFDEEEFNDFILEYSSAMVGFFSEQKLTEILKDKYYEINSKIVFENLSDEIKNNDNKIKGVKI